jgi:hypothetical protein
VKPTLARRQLRTLLGHLFTISDQLRLDVRTLPRMLGLELATLCLLITRRRWRSNPLNRGPQLRISLSPS